MNRDSTALAAQVRLEQTADGVLLPIDAHPKARRNAITGVHDGRLRVSVSQAPERGKANAAIAKLLARALGIKNAQLTLVVGDTSPRKMFRISDEVLDVLRARIAVSLGGD